MFWLYFVRDFYRAASPAVNTAQAAGQHAEIALQYTIHTSRTATIAFQAPQRQPQAVVSAAVVEHPPVIEAEAVAPVVSPMPAAPAELSITSYFQRLSAEGEHAFGVWDEEAGFSLFSANFERVTGLSAGECAGHEWIHAVHHTQQYAINEALLMAAQGLDGRCLVQARRLTGDEEWRWLMVDIKATEQQAAVMVLFRDLTEQKALEEALRQTESALALSERGRSAFLSSMSHELRTPLNAIMGFSEMMQAEVFGALGNRTYAEYVDHIHDSGELLLNKINDLLSIASMESGGMELEESEFHLAQLLAEAVEIHSHTAFARGQQLKLDCPLPALVLKADHAKLLCAVSHMIGNALRHSPQGEEITVSLRMQNGDGCVIGVRDHGEGIPPAQLERIRAALADTATYYNIESGGIGLGLSLTKELTERHGGRIMLDSIRHRGTVVSILLPTERILRGAPAKRAALRAVK